MDIEEIKKEYAELAEQLTDPELISDWQRFQDLSKERAFLEKIIKKSDEIEELQDKLEESKQILSAKDHDDTELVALAEEEFANIKEQIEKQKQELEKLMQQEQEDLPSALIMEIRAGTGGDEAALFARNLYDMYTRYAAKRGWKLTTLDIHETDLDGIREASFILEGEDVYKELQHEGGVHRVQRIPTTEKQGRIHTSTASVALLAKPKKAQIEITPSDLEIDIFNSSGPGGQNVNKRKTAIRITHKPSGIVVASQNSRNQQKNREFAMVQLEAKLLAKEQEEEEQKTSGARKSQIGGAMRAEKIRTYNFPQDRVTDHRTKQNWHGLEKIFQGELDSLLTDLNSGLSEA